MHDLNYIHRTHRKSWDIPWDAHSLTFSCFQRRPFFRGSQSPKWFLENLDVARRETPFDLWAYVLMPEHVHMLIFPHEGVLMKDILRAIKQPLTRRVVKWVEKNATSFLARMADRQTNGKNVYRFWQRGGGYDRNLRSVRDIHEKLAYIHANPVRRGLVSEPSAWQWSSARAWETGVDEPIRIDRDSLPMLINT